MALKNYNPTSPARRGLILIDRSSLFKGKPIKSLTVGLTKSGGRNNQGHATARGIGGGHKQKYRFIDFKRRKWDQPATIERIEYDPNRSPSSPSSNMRTARSPTSSHRSVLLSGIRSSPPRRPTLSRAMRWRSVRLRSARSSTMSR